MRLRLFILSAIVLVGCARMAASPVLPAASSLDAASPLASGYKALFSFNDKDGASPTAALIDYKGELYGTTALGGNDSAGAFFKITPSGQEKTLYSFGGVSGDGLNPEFGPLTQLGGVFYGTTYMGGTSDQGTVFKITPAGAEKVLYRFKGGKDGTTPQAGLTVVKGLLYGTTEFGGGTYCFSQRGCGTVYKVTSSGKETVFYRFQGEEDGAGPAGGLTYLNGKLYGTTANGGAGLGTVFEISLSGSEKVLYSFKAGFSHDGDGPTGNLTDVKGVLYGTTLYGGTYGTGIGTSGTVFRVTTSGVEKVLYSFDGPDGGYPYYTTLAYAKGALYGTTNLGGAADRGTIFKVATGGGGSVFYSFKGEKDGGSPFQGPIDVSGKLFGVASGGGASGHGTVYSVVP